MVSSCTSAKDIWRTLEAEYGNKNIDLALMAIEENNSEEEVIGMMAMSSEAKYDPSQVSISSLKENIHTMSKK